MIIFLFFLSKPYVVTPHLNRLNKMVQMRGHYVCFYAELSSNISKYSLISRALLEVHFLLKEKTFVPSFCFPG